MSTKHPPSGPTEQEVREHFKLSAHATLMRPPYTSIWALEDATLLWDWRNGYAKLDENGNNIPTPIVDELQETKKALRKLEKQYAKRLDEIEILQSRIARRDREINSSQSLKNK